MTPTERQRIENEAKAYFDKIGRPNDGNEMRAYIAGATAENERISEQVKESYKIGWRDGYDDFKNNDLREQLKQERNQAIDEVIALLKDRGWSEEDTNNKIMFRILESLKTTKEDTFEKLKAIGPNYTWENDQLT